MSILRSADSARSELLISRLTENPFVASGRRTFLHYRNLGLGEATHGAVGAAISGTTGEPVEASTGWHSHECELQMFYILRGWFEIEFEATGLMRMEAGTCVNIPPGTPHNETRLSADLEVIEVTIPAELRTVATPNPNLVGGPGPAASPEKELSR